jgi:predicted lipoprotein
MVRTLAVVGLLAVMFVACDSVTSSSGSRDDKRGEGTKLPDGTTFTRAALLGAMGQCVFDNTRRFQSAMDELSQATDAAASDPTKRQGAEDAWKRAMDIWQKLETMQFGPEATSTLPGGQNLRDSIYAWPLGGRCPVEQTLVSKKYETPAFSQELVVDRGLGAVEYLLFYSGADNGCAPSTDINTSGSWAQLGEAEIAARKAAYARAAVADVASHAHALADAWDPAKGNFAGAFASAGAGSKVYPSDAAAFNGVSDALFYVTYATKDMKLGRPVGFINCATPTCPDAVESPYAHYSKAHIRNNLLGFRMLFSGCGENGAGLGFDDYLFALGAATVAKDIDDTVTATLTALDAIKADDLAAALSTDLDAVKAVYDALKRLNDLLKTQFASVLDLELPARIEGDND